MIKLKKKTESLQKRQGKKNKSGPYLKNQNMENLD